MESFNLEEKHKKYLEYVKKLRLIDDVFLEKVIGEDLACAQLLIQIILNRKDIFVENVSKQLPLSNLQGRSARLDIFATDTDGKLYNIEVQRGDAGAVPERARYNSSLLDANITKSGDSYKALRETYVIFITEHDVMQENLPIYHIDRYVRETGKFFNDKSHIIYVNSQNRGAHTALSRLMHDMYCTEPSEMYYATLANRATYFKKDQKGVRQMCELMEEIKKEGIELGIEQGIEQGDRNRLVKSVLTAYRKGKSIYEISDFLDITENEVNDIIKNNTDTHADSTLSKMNFI